MKSPEEFKREYLSSLGGIRESYTNSQVEDLMQAFSDYVNNESIHVAEMNHELYEQNKALRVAIEESEHIDDARMDLYELLKE